MALNAFEGDPQKEDAEVTALNRTWSHLNPFHWVGLSILNDLVYGIVFHPFNFAATRHYTKSSTEPQSSSSILREQWRQHGLKGIYRGFGASTGALALSGALYNVVFEFSRERLSVGNALHTDFISSSVANLLSYAIYSPLGLIACRQMSSEHGVGQHEVYQSMRQHIWDIQKKSGIRGFYVGFGATLWLVPITGLWWGMFEEAKRRLYARHDLLMTFLGDYGSYLPAACTSRTDNAVLNTAAGAGAGAVVSVLANPVWVVRARMQATGVVEHQSLRHVIVSLYRSHGIPGFFQGVLLNTVMYTLDCALYGNIYEALKYFSEQAKY